MSTAKLPSFNSLVRGPGSLGDAMSVSWSGVLKYVNLPFNMIRDVVKKVLMDRAESILVLPYWPIQPWWPILLPHATEMRILTTLETMASELQRSSVVPEILRNPA